MSAPAPILRAMLRSLFTVAAVRDELSGELRTARVDERAPSPYCFVVGVGDMGKAKRVALESAVELGWAEVELAASDSADNATGQVAWRYLLTRTGAVEVHGAAIAGDLIVKGA